MKQSGSKHCSKSDLHWWLHTAKWQCILYIETQCKRSPSLLAPPALVAKWQRKSNKLRRRWWLIKPGAWFVWQGFDQPSSLPLTLPRHAILKFAIHRLTDTILNCDHHILLKVQMLTLVACVTSMKRTRTRAVSVATSVQWDSVLLRVKWRPTPPCPPPWWRPPSCPLLCCCSQGCCCTPQCS